MEFGIAIISTIAYIMVLIGFRKHPVMQQLSFFYIYLIGLTAISHMTVLLPLYFVFSFCPFIKGVYRFSRTTFFLLFYLAIYLVVGILVQDFTATATTFIAKIWQLVVFFMIFDSIIYIKDNISLKQLLLALSLESILGVYLMLNSTMIDATNEMVRLVSGAQPITGNIAIVVLPLIIYLFVKYKQDRINKIVLFFILIIFLLWAILSGTRGYILIYALILFSLVYEYMPKKHNRKMSMTRNAVFFFFMFLVFLIFLLAWDPLLIEKISKVLRIGSSVGIRVFENAAEMDFFIDAPWYTELFGIGLGGIAGEYPEFLQAISRQASLGMWNLSHYLLDAGAPYHNLYANILLNLGVIGLVVTLVINVMMWRRISDACDDNMFFKRTFHLYQIGFIWMNYYRWSGDCGISEMIIFAMVLKMIKEEKRVN